MTDRRLAPLTALSTLTRRPPRVEARAPLGSLPAPAAPARSRMVDNAVYSAGRRVATPETAAESRQELDEGEDRLAWLGLYRPEAHELGELAELFDLPELAVEDAIKAHQRPKFERYGDSLCRTVMTKSAPRNRCSSPNSTSSASSRYRAALRTTNSVSPYRSNFGR